MCIRDSLRATIQDLIISIQTPVSSNNSHITNSTLTEPQVKLPQINLPTFGGSYDEWPSFQDSFRALIHDNNSLSDVQRFHYLKSTLRNGASQIIHSLEVSSANYQVAWDLLKGRYDNKKLIINKHLQSLFNLSVLDKESATSIRQFSDNIQKHMRALKSLGQPVQHWDAVITYLIVNKFDQSTRHAWEASTSTTELATYSETINFLENRSKILEGCEEGQKMHSKPKSRPVNATPQRKSSQDFQTAFVSTNLQKCPMCSKFHRLFQCQHFLKLNPCDRITKVKELQLCINCLKPGHKAATCENTHSCKTCNKRHNSLLHLNSQNPCPDLHYRLSQLHKHQLSNQSC